MRVNHLEAGGASLQAGVLRGQRAVIGEPKIIFLPAVRHDGSGWTRGDDAAQRQWRLRNAR